MRKLLFFVCVLLPLSVCSQEKRLALVIGNSAYEHGGVLPNPINDAFAMNQALTDVGFEVLEYFNLDEGELKQAIDKFGLKLRNYDVGLFYYAGHGIQSNGENYLIPIEANLISELQVEYDCVEAARVLAHMDASRTSVNIVILDACRNNPFERSWNRSSSGKGLAFMDAPSGTIIAYATSPGSTASDGIGLNGLYTEAILESIQVPGITILQVFQNVRGLVTERSNNQQTPWESTSLIGDFYFLRGEGSNLMGQQKLQESGYDNTLASTASEFSGAQGIFIDSRDKQEYKWVKIGDQVWMAENLNYNVVDGVNPTSVGESKWDKKLMGILYSMELAIENCPDGWHLPNVEEWTELKESIGSYNAGGKLKAVDTIYWQGINEGAVNSSGFTALPMSGGTNSWIWEILQEGNEAVFWSSTEIDIKKGYTYRLYSNSSDLHIVGDRKKWFYSVRCVKD